MDFNSILSLLKDQNIKTPEINNQTQPPLPAQSQPPPIDSNNLLGLGNINLANISQDVINQVRSEYLSKKSKEDIKNATSITPEVLVAIGNMVKETPIIKVLQHCKERQDKKEKELFQHRESIKERYKKQRESLLAKELIGAKVDPNELRLIERDMNSELHRMDLQILKDMDGEVKYLQQEFVKLNVPLFKVSNNINDIKLQQKVLSILQDMI